jgi:dihydrofolate reductase
MRKVVVYELMSLDGVAEEPDSFITDWDNVMDANLATVIQSQDVVILGRRTYNEWARFWPDSDIQPFSNFINNTKKYVATSKAIDFDWVNAAAIDGEVVDFVRDLKGRPGSDIGVHASISVAHTLLQAGLVDELHLVIAPRIVGVGRKLLDSLPAIRLALTQSLISPTGHLLLTYVVTQ